MAFVVPFEIQPLASCQTKNRLFTSESGETDFRWVDLDFSQSETVYVNVEIAETDLTLKQYFIQTAILRKSFW